MLAFWLSPRPPHFRDPASGKIATPPEEKVADTSPTPAPGEPLRVALVVAGDDGEPGFKGYAVDVSDSACDGKPAKEWLATGKTVWLYGEDGALGRGVLDSVATAKAEGEEETPGCSARRPLREVRSRRHFAIAAPHGHGVSPVRNTAVVREEGELPRFDKLLADAIRRQLKEFGSHRNGFRAVQWTLKDDRVLYAVTIERTKLDDKNHLDIVDELSLGCSTRRR